MKVIELIKEKLIGLISMSIGGVWISQEELDEAAKEIEKIIKEHSEDRLAELEKVILDYYLAEGYRVGVGGWHFVINISTSYKRKEIQIMFRQDESSNSETVFRTYKQSTKEMFDAAFEYFSIKE